MPSKNYPRTKQENKTKTLCYYLRHVISGSNTDGIYYGAHLSSFPMRIEVNENWKKKNHTCHSYLIKHYCGMSWTILWSYSISSPIQVEVAVVLIWKLKRKVDRKYKKIIGIIVDPHVLVAMYERMWSKLVQINPCQMAISPTLNLNNTSYSGPYHIFKYTYRGQAFGVVLIVVIIEKRE